MSLSVLLRLTLSGSALALVLLGMRYVFFKRMPSTAYYYAWLLVLLRFVLPLPGLVPEMTGESAVPMTAISTPAPLERAPLSLPQADGFQPVNDLPPAESSPIEKDAARAGEPVKHGLNLKSPTLWLMVWVAGTGICLAVYGLSYALFTARVRRSLSPATWEDRRVYARLGGRRPRLYRCAAYDTPLMFGVIHPIITLPERDYDEALLTNILRHELTHYRRRDPLYKWFAVAVLSTQWFNPLSWVIRRELNRACELSCDERLLRTMDRADKLSYGHTLLNMAESAALPAGVVATTFSTEKRNLKERLEQIMNYKKSTARVLAAVLALLLLAGCTAMAGPAPKNAAAEPEGDAENVVRVSTVDELLAAIAPDTVIELAAGTYDLSAASNYGQDTHSSYYSWNGAYDGFELTLHNVQNLALRGAGKGETVLAAVPRYANVLKFINCGGVKLENITAGHTTEPGFCMGGVLSFEMTDDATVENCGLYGCGTIGVQARNCNDLTVKSSEIYECSYGAVNVQQCRNVTVTDCDIHDHGTRAGQGDAMFLFDVNYSEDVTIYKNRIHDNRAQYMLMGDYARRVLFLTNEVRGNSFVSSVFQLRGYGITADGCAFEGNDVRGGWYQGDVYAGDIDGNLLEGAVLAEMTYRDIDPATASPLASVGDPTEVPKGGSITVSTVDDFLAAIGPDRTIILDGELFDLSTASNYGGIGTDCYYWAENYDGPQLVIHDVNGLSIQAQNTESGATTLAAIPRYADVIYFRNCDNLFLGGFTAGHTKEPGSCSGGVLRFEDCNQVMLEKMRLFGCGILGIQASQCSSLDILRTEIYECSQGAAQFFRTDGIRFQDCNIHDVPTPALSFSESGDKTWNGEPINDLNGQYDVGSDGTLIACSIESSGGDVLVIPEDSPEYAFLSEIQKDIAHGDWEILADNMTFPLTIVIPSEKHDTNYVQIPNKETFLSRELDQIMNIQYRRYVENARIGTATPTIWGYAALDESICFTVSANNAPKVTALIISASRIAASQNVNPFNSEPPIPFEEGTPQLDFAKAVQKAFAEQDWDALAAKIEFPLQLNGKDRYSMVQSAEDFHSMVHGSINPFTPEFCELIVNADLATYGASMFGSTFAAHRLAFTCVSDILRTADDLRITCISFDEPLYRYQTAQALPPTPMPLSETEGLRVLFYETEIKTDFTLWPGDPTELHAQISPELAVGAEFEWTTDNPSVLRIEKTGTNTANITCIDDGSLPQTCKLTVSCGGLQKELTVYCRQK